MDKTLQCKFRLPSCKYLKCLVVNHRSVKRRKYLKKIHKCKFNFHKKKFITLHLNFIHVQLNHSYAFLHVLCLKSFALISNVGNFSIIINMFFFLSSHLCYYSYPKKVILPCKFQLIIHMQTFFKKPVPIKSNWKKFIFLWNELGKMIYFTYSFLHIYIQQVQCKVLSRGVGWDYLTIRWARYHSNLKNFLLKWLK